MSPIILPAMEVIAKLLTYVTLKEKTKYIDQYTRLRQDLMHEEAKGYGSDDAKIVMLYKEIHCLTEALNAEISSNNKPVSA
jgi:hypothetical protein